MLVSSMVTVLGLAFVIGILSHSFQRQLMNELKKEAVFISRGVEAAGTDYLDQLSNTDSRITYVDESGKVLYDNEADVENMENHGHRKEIREAELNGEGEDERMSSTLSEKTMYYALRLDNGNVLRVSSTQKSAFALVWQLVPPLLGVLFLILVLSDKKKAEGTISAHKSDFLLIKMFSPLPMTGPSQFLTEYLTEPESPHTISYVGLFFSYTHALQSPSAHFYHSIHFLLHLYQKKEDSRTLLSYD